MLLMPGAVFGTPLAPAPSQRTDEPIVYWLLYQKRSTSGCVGRETELLGPTRILCPNPNDSAEA